MNEELTKEIEQAKLLCRNSRKNRKRIKKI